MPLEGEGLEIIRRLMTRPPLWCPYLFHGPDCAPGHAPSRAYGCVGDFRKAWRTACTKAKLPAGRKADGFLFHHTRNTFATDFIAGGGSVEDAMAVANWKTRHMVGHYNLGNVDALRQRLTRARLQAAAVAQLGDSTEQRGVRRRAPGSCTAPTQQAVAADGEAR
jgi:integrase